MQALMQHVSRQLQQSGVEGRTLVAALSGGRDSVALTQALWLLREPLGFTLRALHVNHHLQSLAGHWQQFCEQFCAERGIELQVVHLQLTPAPGDSVEALARAGRYQAFAAADGDYVVLAHHQDDQAETLLLQALRGAGVAGLAAMPDRRQHGSRSVLRPLLDVPRCDIERALQQAGLSWIEDASNADVRWRRNAVRHQLLPALQAIVPGAVAALARTARHCGEASELLRELAALDADLQAPTLPLARLQALSPARARNVLRQWLWQRGVTLPSTSRLHEFERQIHQAAPDRQPQLQLAGGRLWRWRDALHWAPDWQAQPATLHWHGQSRMRLPGWQGELIFQTGAHGLDPDWLRHTPLGVAFRQGGETLELAPDRPPQSLKNLLHDSHIPPWERQRWPLLWHAQQLVAVPGIGLYYPLCRAGGVQLQWQPDATLASNDGNHF